MKPGADEGADRPQQTQDVAAFTECTGLLPALPATEEGERDQLALYAVTKARRRKRKNDE